MWNFFKNIFKKKDTAVLDTYVKKSEPPKEYTRPSYRLQKFILQQQMKEYCSGCKLICTDCKLYNFIQNYYYSKEQ